MVLKVIPTISFLCAFIVIVVWTLLFFNTENDFRTTFIFIFMYYSWSEQGLRPLLNPQYIPEDFPYINCISGHYG